MSTRAVLLGAATLLCGLGAHAQDPNAPAFPFLPDSGWATSTACSTQYTNVAPDFMTTTECIKRVSEVQWDCPAVDGVGNVVNQILEGIHRTFVMQQETEIHLADLVGALAGNGSNTGIGAAAAVSLPDEFLDSLGDAMGDGELTADEAFCSGGEDCVNDLCADGVETCSSAGAALINTLATNIAQNMNSAAGLSGTCYEDEEPPAGCIDPSAIMVTDIDAGGRRRMQESGAHHTPGMDFYHVYCLGLKCSASV